MSLKKFQLSALSEEYRAIILKEQRQKFARSHKVTEHGRVEERMMYHGSSLENINKIVTEGFCLDAEPEDRERRKLMLFGRGVYLSPLPGVRDGSFNLPHTLPFTPQPRPFLVSSLFSEVIM